MSYTSLYYHIVFAAKNRERWLKREHMPRIAQYAGGIARNLKCSLIAADGDEDHLHLAAIIHPSVAVAKFVGTVKANTTGWIHDSLDRMDAFAWQEKYSAFTVSNSQVPKVLEYIENQELHHQKRSSVDELAALLRLHEIPFDPAEL